MKLKKIASLMLAGVMAVSMLAGCSGNPDPNPGEGEGEGNATGYSAELASNLSSAAKKDYITFADNAADADALKDALGNLGSVPVAAGATVPMTVVPVDELTGNAVSTFAGIDLVIADFTDALEFRDNDVQLGDLYMKADVDADEIVKDGVLYVIDGTVDAKKAVKQVAAQVENALESLDNHGTEGVTTYTYDYTVSVSVVNKALAPFAGYTLSANFIAVTVTRVPTAA